MTEAVKAQRRRASEKDKDAHIRLAKNRPLCQRLCSLPRCDSPTPLGHIHTRTRQHISPPCSHHTQTSASSITKPVHTSVSDPIAQKTEVPVIGASLQPVRVAATEHGLKSTLPGPPKARHVARSSPRHALQQCAHSASWARPRPQTPPNTPAPRVAPPPLTPSRPPPRASPSAVTPRPPPTHTHQWAARAGVGYARATLTLCLSCAWLRRAHCRSPPRHHAIHDLAADISSDAALGPPPTS